MEWNKNVLIGTIGYHNLSNHSIGPLLFEPIKAQPWAHNVTVEELNWGPIAIVQWFQSLEKPFDRVVLLTAITRNRRIGEVTVYKWGGGMPESGEIQARIGDAVTGVISPENLLIIGEHFGIWPGEVYLIDIEPGPEKAGQSMTTELSERAPEYLDILEKVSRNGEENSEKFAILYGDQMPA